VRTSDVPTAYPFMLPDPVVEKLGFVHERITSR
jgi:hypothetical protein